MSDQFIAEIRIFPFNFAPPGWAMCNGQILPIAQNMALFSLLGTTYGGDGVKTFALPHLRGALPLKFGQGPGLSAYAPGQSGGVTSVVLSRGQLPAHSHGLRAFTEADAAPHAVPQANDSLTTSQGGDAYAARGGTLAPMGPSQVGNAGGDAAHNNQMPSVTLNYCIALTGIFPARP